VTDEYDRRRGARLGQDLSEQVRAARVGDLRYSHSGLPEKHPVGADKLTDRVGVSGGRVQYDQRLEHPPDLTGTFLEVLKAGL